MMDYLSSTRQPMKKRVAKKMGDSAIIYGIVHSPFWAMIFKNFWKAIRLVIKQFFQASAAISAFLFTSVTRCFHGANTCGWSLLVVGSLYICAYNSPEIWEILTPIMVFLIPFFIYFLDLGWSEIYGLATIHVHSQILVFYNGVFILSTIVHIIISYVGLAKDLNSRGRSYLYLLANHLFSKYFNVNEFFLNVLECLLVIGLGIYLIRFQIEIYAGWFFVAIAFNEAVILLGDKTVELHNKPLLES